MGILEFMVHKKNIILMLISIEIMFLAILFLILVSSLSFDNILGWTDAIYVIAIASAESAIGSGILVTFYRFHSCLNLILFILWQKNWLFTSCICTTYYVLYTWGVNFCKIIVTSYLTNYFKDYYTYHFGKYLLYPCFITEFFDTECFFVITLLKNLRYITGWNV